MAHDPDHSSHHLDKTFANGKTEARPTVFPGRGPIGLAERLKQPFTGLLGDPDTGVRHRNPNRRFLLRLRLNRHFHDHISPFGELDGVGRQVHHNLPEAARIAKQISRHIGMEETGQIEPFGRCAFRHEVQGFFDGQAQIELDRLQIQFPRFNLGKIENVVDDRQQVIAASPNRFSVFTLFIRQCGVQQETGHPYHTVHRCPDFVTHGREERRLGLGGGFGFSQCGVQLLIDMLQLSGIILLCLFRFLPARDVSDKCAEDDGSLDG